LILHFSISGQDKRKDLEYRRQISAQITNLDSLFYFSSKLEKSKDSCMLYYGKIHKALFYYRTGNLEMSEEIAKDITTDLQYKNTFCLKKIRIESLNRLFWIYKNKNLFDSAFDCLLEIKEEIKKIPENEDYYETINLTLNVNLALIKSLLDHHIEARNILKKNLSNSKNNSSAAHRPYSKVLNQANILNLIGKSYLNSSTNSTNKDLDSASIYFKKAFEVAKKFNPPHEDSESLYQIREAKVLIAKKNFLGALSLVQKFNANSKKFKTQQNINSLKAICFYQLNTSDSAIYYSKKYLSHEKLEAIPKKKLTAIYDVLANQYYKDKEIDSAFKYSELTIRAINALNESKSKVNKSHYLHDFKDAKTLNKVIITNNKNDKNLFITYGIMLFLITLFIAIFFYIMNKKTNNKYNNQFKNRQKKVYLLDKDLEHKILKGIEELEETKDYLDASFTIHVLAKKINTNTSYLSYTFNKVKNKSFKQYITALRILYLIKKLEEDKEYRKYTIKYLAEEIGYTNASAFTRAFKKHQGVIPSEFIKSLCEKN
jgi:AraC-like DNA-binding protein